MLEISYRPELKMFRQNTVFIIGAGASAEAGLPLGSALAKRVSNALRFDPEAIRAEVGSGNPEIYRAILNFAGPANSRGMLKKCRELSFSLAHADSIDACLNDFRTDEDLMYCGKVAIAYEIARAEQNSLLSVRNNNIYNTIDWNSCDGLWYSKFFRILKDGIDSNSIEDIFDNVEIICFNYDRCIEQYLFYALRDYYRISAGQAIKLLNKLTLIHPYGVISGFQADINTGHSNFGQDLASVNIGERARTIRTIFEANTDAHKVADIRASLAKAEQLIFLGFGFHKLNMNLLKRPLGANVGHTCYATGYKLPNPGLPIIQDRIHSIFGIDLDTSRSINSISLQNITCRQLLDEFDLLLAP